MRGEAGVALPRGRCGRRCAARVDRGLEPEGALPGRLGLRRKAYSFFRKARLLGRDDFRSEAFVAAYAYAVAEENAAAGSW